MSINDILHKDIERRDFLKGTGKAALGLAGLLTGCSPTLKETRKDVESIKWDCNPILPIPAEGCYAATNEEIYWLGEEKRIVTNFRESYGIPPAFNNARGKYAVFNYAFPAGHCKEIIEHGVIPVMVYSIKPFSGFKPIIKGKFDDHIKEFANKVAKFEHPIVLLPFVQPTEPYRSYTPWAGYPPNQYKDAWVRIHDLFSKEGANRNTIWSSKLQVGSWPSFTYPDPFAYIPPEQYIDIIGWQCNNISQPQIGLPSMRLREQFSYYYNRASRKYPKKPQAFWELSSPWDPKQHVWWDNALDNIKNKYFRVKIVAMDVISWFGHFYFDARQTPETIQKIRQHFADPYFIGSAIKK
jgi:hypothetical protein